MANYKDYSAIKRMIEEYFLLRKDKNYDEFIKKLTEILRI